MPVPYQDVPHHPEQLEDHEAGSEGPQILFFNGGVLVCDGKHQRRPDQQQIGPVLPAQELRVLLRIVFGQTDF